MLCARVGDLAFCGVVETGGADDQLDAELAADRQVRQRAFGAREVDQHLGVGEAFAQVGGDAHAAVAAEERARRPGRSRGCRRRRARRPACTSSAAHDRFDQHPAHAAGRTGDRDAQRGSTVADSVMARLERRVAARRPRRARPPRPARAAGGRQRLDLLVAEFQRRRAARQLERCRSRRRTRARPAGRRRCPCSSGASPSKSTTMRRFCGSAPWRRIVKT